MDKPHTRLFTKLRVITLLLVSLLTIVPPALLQASAVTWDDYNNIQSQIDALQKEINGYISEANRLASEADSLSRAKSQLQNEIKLLEADIALSNKKKELLDGQIAVNEKKISDANTAIGSTLVDMYITDDVSLLERLASTRNFADFVDDAAKLAASSDGLSATVKIIKEAKAELEKQKKEVELVIQEQENQKQAKDTKVAEYNRLIQETKDKEDLYWGYKNNVDASKKDLEAKQRQIYNELLASSQIVGGDPNKGGYPYSGVCPGQQDWFFDDWALMYICECTSYASWKVYQHYGYFPASMGNAQDWYWHADQYGIPRGSTPKTLSVAYWTAYPYGHVAWVEGIDWAGGRILVSDYNVVRGDYSRRWDSMSRYEGYIYFGEW